MQRVQNIRKVTRLETKLTKIIKNQGAMPLDQYMAIVMDDYYKHHVKIGKRRGDFITSPEISPIFGATIANWLVRNWEDMGRPAFNLIEVGGGNGTLMHDILRFSKNNHEMHQALNRVYMIESSQKLQDMQKKTLESMQDKIDWIESLDNYEPNCFTIIISNELFDALPIKQYVRKNEQVYETCITYRNGRLDFGIMPSIANYLPNISEKLEDGEMLECSPAAQALAQHMAAIIKKHGGIMLAIDYGFENDSKVFSLQAVRDQQKVGFFHMIGQSDITAHVDFSALALACRTEGVEDVEIASQGEFLLDNGIEHISQRLFSQLNPKHRGVDALERLTGDEHMGTLFKALTARQRVAE
jgi:NADH dehydrogenase [ubiquinone] 1 alpha subcomplex assembly factor 7